MSTLDRMLSVLMAAREARHGSTLQVDSEEGASKRSRRSARRRRTSIALASEPLEHRQMLAVTTYAQYFPSAGDSWTTVVAEPGDNVFIQQVATNQQSLYIADNSSFENRTMVGGPIPVGSTASQLLPGFDVSNLGRIEVTTGMPRRDDYVLNSYYPMSVKPASNAVKGYTRVTLTPQQVYGGIFTDRQIKGFIEIEQPDGKPARWEFENYIYRDGLPAGNGGDPSILTGIGKLDPVSPGQYYPTALSIRDGNSLEIEWSIPQLPKVPRVTLEGTYSAEGVFDNSQRPTPFTMYDVLPSAPATCRIDLPNSYGNNALSIIPSTFAGVVEIGGTQFAITAGHGQGVFSIDGEVVTGERLWFSSALSPTPGGTGFFRRGYGQVQGILRTGLPSADGTTPRELLLSTQIQFPADFNNRSYTPGFPVTLVNATYAVATTGKPATATVFAGHDISAALEINLLSPGSSIYIDSPVLVTDSRLRSNSFGATSRRNADDDILLNATNVYLNAAVSTPDTLSIGSENFTAAASKADGLMRATAVASIENGKVVGLTIPSGLSGAGYDTSESRSPIVTIAAPRAEQAVASVSGLVNGSVKEIRVSEGGSGYSVIPTVVISGPDVRGGTQMTATANVTGGVVTSITITNFGTGYTKAPTVRIVPAITGNPPAPAGAGATAEAVFTGSVSKVFVEKRGSGYIPGSFDVAFVPNSGFSGSGAKGKAYVGLNGSIDRIEVLPGDGGQDYAIGGTTVVLIAPNDPDKGRQATARAIVNRATSQIVRLEIIDGGGGYGLTPDVTIESPRQANSDVRLEVTTKDGSVTSVAAVTGTGLVASAALVNTDNGALINAVVGYAQGGTGYAIGDVLDLNSATGTHARLRVLDVLYETGKKTGSVKTLEVVWGGSGYQSGQTLTHDGRPTKAYRASPTLWIEPPQTGDGVQAVAKADVAADGTITFTLSEGGKGYTSTPAHDITPLHPVSTVELLEFNASVAASSYSISLDDDRSTITPRSKLYVSNSATLAATIAEVPGGETTPARFLNVESHRGDVFVVGVINVEKQSYLLQSDAKNQMLFPYRFTTSVPEYDLQNGLITGQSVAVTLANDLPTLSQEGVASNDVSLRTKIDSLRIRAAWSDGRDRADPFPYTASIDERDDLAIDAVAASGSPLSFKAAGNLRTNAVISTANDLAFQSDAELTVTSPITGRNIAFSGVQVTATNTITATGDITVDATAGGITLAGGTVTAGAGPDGTVIPGKSVRFNQKGSPLPASKDYTYPGNVPSPLGQTLSVPITINDSFTADDVNITLSLTASTLADLKAELVSPSGVKASLFDYGTLSGTVITRALFNDQSSKSILEGKSPYTPEPTLPADATAQRGFRTPLTTLAAFNGSGVTGTWKLNLTARSNAVLGAVDYVQLTLRDPIGSSEGDAISTSLIRSDQFIVEATGSLRANTDVNTVSAVVGGDIILADIGAVDITSARAGGTVWLAADGVDTDHNTVALKAYLLDINRVFVTAPNGSIDAQIVSDAAIQLMADSSKLEEFARRTFPGMRAAGSVTIRSAAGTFGGDIAVLDAPLAGFSDKTVNQIVTVPLINATYTGNLSGFKLSALVAGTAGSLQSVIMTGTAPKLGDKILIGGGIRAAGDSAQTDKTANGVYTVVDLGSSTTPWKLQRSTDFDTKQELPSGSIVRLKDGHNAGSNYRISYDATKAFGFTDMTVELQNPVANIHTEDPNDTVRFVVSSYGSTNSAAGSFGKMIELAQRNHPVSSNPGGQKQDFLISSELTGPIKLTQELPRITTPLDIDGARRWNIDDGGFVPGGTVPLTIDGSRIVTSFSGNQIVPGAEYNGFWFTSTSGGSTNHATLTNIIVGGFNQGAAVTVDSAANVRITNNWIGFSGTKESVGRLGNKVGTRITASGNTVFESGAAPTLSGNHIGNSRDAAVVIDDKASYVKLFGNEIGVEQNETSYGNNVGIDVRTSGVGTTIGDTEQSRNVIRYNTSGVRLADGSGETIIANSEISSNATGIYIVGGKHIIGGKGPRTSIARNAVFANSGWGVRIEGKAGSTIGDLLTLAKDQMIQGNLFVSPSAAPGDISSLNGTGAEGGAIGIRLAGKSTVEDFSQKPEGMKYEVSPITGTDDEENQYRGVVDDTGPVLSITYPRAITARGEEDLTNPSAVIAPGGLTVFGSNANRVKAFVLRVSDDGSGVAAATVVKEAFSLTLNGTALTEGTDYKFLFSDGTVFITCTTASGLFAQGEYKLTATGKAGTSSNSGAMGGGALTDAANNPLQGNQTGTNVAIFTMLLSDVPGIVKSVSSAVGDASATVSWKAPTSTVGAPITAHVVQYTLVQNIDDWKEVPPIASTAASLTVTGLTNGSSYKIRVAAVNVAGRGPWAESPSIIPRTLATAPQNVQATAGNSSVVLTWAAPLSDGGAAVTDYSIEKSTDAGKTWSGVVDGVSTNTTATVSSLTNGTAYLFRVATLTTAGQGVWAAATASVTPFGLPGVASNLRAVGADSGAVLTWTAPASNGAAISDYVIQKSTDGGTSWSDAVDGVSGAATTTVSGLTNGTAHVFRVAAKNAAGTGGWTAASAAVTPLSRASGPLNLQAVAGDGRVVLSWVAPESTSGATVTDYRIQQSVNGGTTWSDVTDGVSNATTATITGLTNGTTYLFQVAAVTSVGDGAWTAATTGVTPRGLASVPLNVQAAGGDGQVALSWSAPASLGGSPLRDYLVQSSTDGGVTWTDFTDGVVATTGATVTELSNGTSYMFRVAAVTDFETGTFSPATAAIVPLAAPGAVTDLRAVPSSGQVVLVWQAPSSTGGRPVIDYHVEYRATHSESWVTYSRVPSAATSATITGLPASSGYVFRVTAVTDYTRGLPVETTEPVVLVPQPTRVTGRAANGSVLLAWMPPKVNRSLRVIDYRIQYSADGGATWITASKTASPSARATVRGLMKGTGYIFRVAAVTAKGVGAYSVSSARVTTRRI